MKLTRINNKYYDLTPLLKSHSGGEAIIAKYIGKDATKAFKMGNHPDLAIEKLEQYYVCEIDELNNYNRKLNNHHNLKLYDRKNIPDDYEKPPTSYEGTIRHVVLLYYYFLYICGFLSLLSGIYCFKSKFVFILMIEYLLNNIGFTLGHVQLHLNFMESREEEMSILSHHSFIHHYRDIRVYDKYWLETRTSYFLNGHMLNLILLNLICAITIYYLTHNLILSFTYFGLCIFFEILQSTVHEWYHIPPSERKEFYSYPVFYFYTILTRIGILNDSKHTLHHDHDLENLNDVEDWADMYFPFSDILPSYLFQKYLNLHEPGKRLSSTKARELNMYSFIFHFVLLLSFFFLS